MLRAQDETNWPSFLYPDGMVFDPENLNRGLFHGHVFIWVRTDQKSSFSAHFFPSLCARFIQKNPLHSQVITQHPNT